MTALNEIKTKQHDKFVETDKLFNKYLGVFTAIQNTLQETDLPTTSQAINTAKEAEKSFAEAWKKWKQLKK
jgi:hypothetical protein